MKIIATLLLFCSTFAMAQPQVNFGSDDKGTYRIKRDSFATYKENGQEYVGLTTDFLLNGSTDVAQHVNFKMLSKDCGSKETFDVLRINDDNTKVLETTKTKLVNNGGITSVMAALICDYVKQVKLDPQINENSLQNIKIGVYKANENQWSADMPITNGRMATLNSSMKFENVFVSIVIRVKTPKPSTEYYKLYIDKDDCRDNKKGEFLMKNLDMLEMEDIPFDLNTPPTDKQLLQFHRIAKNMCEYTMKNNVFKKRIILEDYNKPSEYKGNMFDGKKE